ncbi:DUF3325 family protein [Cupriavidus basilensis]
MNASLGFFTALALTYSGFTALSQTLDRHYADRHGRGSSPCASERLRLHGLELGRAGPCAGGLRAARRLADGHRLLARHADASARCCWCCCFPTRLQSPYARPCGQGRWADAGYWS